MQNHTQVEITQEDSPEENKRTSVAQIRSSPLPSPQEMKEYDKVYKGMAKDIVNMASSEQKHRHRTMFVGQIIPLTVAIFGFALVGFLAYHGHDWLAGCFASGELLAIIYAVKLGSSSK